MNSNKHIDGCFTNTLSRRRFLTRSAIVAAGGIRATGPTSSTLSGMGKRRRSIFPLAESGHSET
jgi:hypothetical protein